MSSRGDLYDAGYERRAAAGENVHGEADFVGRWSPATVLDAGCGTGRVGRELARRGALVIGVDIDPEMLATARRKAPAVTWLEADLATLDLDRSFEVVLMAGNVINFVVEAQRRGAVRNLARLVGPGGRLITGHSLRPDGCSAEDLDRWAAEAGLVLAERWSTWDRDPYLPDSDYSLSVHRRPD